MGIFMGKKPDGPAPTRRVRSVITVYAPRIAITGPIDQVENIMREQFYLSEETARAIAAGGLSIAEVNAAFAAAQETALRGPVALICDQCSTASPGDAAFCIGCGQRFGQANTGETTKL